MEFEDGEEMGRKLTPSETGGVPNRMVITLAIVGPMDVQEEWSRKYQLFCDR